MQITTDRRRRPFIAFAILMAALCQSAIPAQDPFRRGWESASPATVTGELILEHVDDFVNARSQTRHVLHDERTGKAFTLLFEGAVPQHLKSGTRVQVRGRANDAEVYVAAADGGVEFLGTSQSSITGGEVTGDQRTLVIVTHFQDKQVNPMVQGADCSIAAIRDRMFTHPQDQSVDDMYRAASFGNVSFSGTVAGPYTIDVQSTDACNTSAWSNLADAAATASGHNPAEYARRVYVMPSNSCPAAGIGEVGVTPSRAWVFTCDRPRIYAHELGHNLGMDHASDLESEYGDGSDVMGLAEGLASFNGPHKTQMGWLPATQAAVIAEDGLYNVAPLARDASSVTSPQVLKVAIPGTSDAYFLSYRHGGGFEANACCSYLDRLNVHRWAGGASRTMLLATLADGATFQDSVTGFTVTQLSHNYESATVQIDVTDPAPACGSVTPIVTMTPRDQSGGPASMRAYDVTLTNSDSSGCAASTFRLNGNTPSGWTGSWSASTLTLTPGSIGSARWSVTSPSSAQAGTYNLTANVSDVANAVHSASSVGTFTLTGDANPPTPPATLTTKIKGKQVTLSWDTSTDDVGVVFYRVWRDGVAVATVNSTSWTDLNVAPGAYTYFVTASDAAGNWSQPSSSVLVRVSGGRGK